MDEAQVRSRARLRADRRLNIRAVCARAVWGTAEEKSILIVGSGFEIADFVRKSKRRFGFVVKLIANKYYMDLFRYLSFLPSAIGLPSSAVQTFDLLFTSDQSPRSIGKPNCWII